MIAVKLEITEFFPQWPGSFSKGGLVSPVGATVFAELSTNPFPSKVTGTPLTFGVIDKHHPLTITFHMVDNGVIFSDGIETSYLSFNSDVATTISVADKMASILSGQTLSTPEVDNEYLN